MPATRQEVENLILQGFPNAHVDLQEDDHRVVGTIISEKFKNMESEQRNELVTKEIRDKLGLNGINVGFLFPLAPGEYV